MQVHILAGDSLAGDLRETEIRGNVIVMRECLIDGPVGDKPLTKFFETRAKYMAAAYNAQENYYFENTVPELEKIAGLPSDAEVNLWFEYELFCQVNMWFVLDLLKSKEARIYRVFPSVRTEDDRWKGFGSLTSAELEKCYGGRARFTPEETELGAKLWAAYRVADLETLKTLSNTSSKCFPYLREVCEAEIERKRDRRPQKTLQRIIKKGVMDFSQVFTQFSLEEGIYGFGDLQVRSMYEKL